MWYNFKMQNILKKPFFILKNNLIFIQPLLLYLLLQMTALSFILGRNIYTVPGIVLVVSMLLLTVAFAAGWLFINKLGILNYNPEDSKDEITVKAVKNFRMFFEGVGANFIKTFAAGLLYAAIYTAAMFVTGKICLEFLGKPDIIFEFQKIMQASNQAEIVNILNNISIQQKIIFSGWVMAFNAAASVMNFIGVLYFAVIFIKESDLLKSLFETIVFLIKNFLNCIFIIFIMFFLYLVLNLLSVIMGANSFSFVILIIFFTIYLNYYILLVFCFYNDKTKSNSNNGTELVRENETGN